MGAYAGEMCVSVTVLASGSRGNSALVASSTTRILVDAGISCREIFKRMRGLGEDPLALSAVVITHEHSDHVNGLATLAKRLNVPVFMTGATHHAWARAVRDQKGEAPRMDRPFLLRLVTADLDAGVAVEVPSVALLPGERISRLLHTSRLVDRQAVAGTPVARNRGGGDCQYLGLLQLASA